jgi:hypothetical protein
MATTTFDLLCSQITIEAGDITTILDFFIIENRYYISIDEKNLVLSRKSFKKIIIKLTEEFFNIELKCSIYEDIYFNDTSYKDFEKFLKDDFESFLDICEDINKESNNKIFKRVLIENTNNKITNTLPRELIEMIIKFIN